MQPANTDMNKCDAVFFPQNIVSMKAKYRTHRPSIYHNRFVCLLWGFARCLCCDVKVSDTLSFGEFGERLADGLREISRGSCVWDRITD